MLIRPLTNILIVNDDPENRCFLRDVLSNEKNNNLFIASDSSAALRIIKENKIDLILLSLLPRNSTSIKICKSIRSTKMAADVIVVVYGENLPKLRKAAYTLGANDYIDGSADKYEILSRINFLIEQKQLVANLASAYSKMHSELEEARSMMLSLLPGVEKIKEINNKYNIKVESFYKPSSQLGGDFYDISPLSKEAFSMLMWDFSGHGVSAAINTFRLHTIINNNSQCIIRDPGTFLSYVNEALSHLLSKNSFATMFYGIYDNIKKEMVYSCASCQPPMLLSFKSKEIELIKSSEFALGVVKEHKYNTSKVSLKGWDALVLYSDALVETYDNSDMLTTIEELGKAVLDCKVTRPGEIKDKILSTFGKQRLDNLKDDLTLKVIHLNN